jgi:anti-anti-sigma factor
VDPFTLELPADAGTPRRARRAVAARLGGHPRLEELLLCVSEVVTNAVLHTRAPKEMVVRAEGDRLVVEVADGDPTLPIRRAHDLTAPTGRGLRILDELTSAWGTREVSGGKVVWFAFDLSTNGSPPAGFRRVRMIGVPLDVHRRNSEHGEALRRELAFVANAADPEGAPVRLYTLGVELTARYGGLTVVQEARLQDALASGEATIDLDYDLPVDMADGIERLGALVDELDDFCRDGELLTLVTPAEGLAYRRWFLGEILEQLRTGREPLPWSESELSHVAVPVVPEPGAIAASAPSETTISVTEDLDLELAPVLREEIVALVEGGATRVELDLSGCDFLDSTGLSLLVTTHRRLAADGGALRLRGVHGQVASILDMSGVHDLLVDA